MRLKHLFISVRGDAVKGHVTVNGDKISKAVEYCIICSGRKEIKYFCTTQLLYTY